MSSKKKDLEIIYNLQWKNGPANGGDKANIIGMYDIPATTLNWEVFKSYLLKNSGTVGDDVKVSYITDSNREFPIESQTDFQIALYAFRRKARMGDIVNLKLDRISDQPTHKNNRHSNDVETQFDNEATSLPSTCCNADTPPEWFITYMNQFKKNFAEELTVTMSNIVTNIKPHTVSQPSCYHSRKSKGECPKRTRKLPTLIAEPLIETKDLIKSLKLDSKLERKLEKLEHKTKKLKEKKVALLIKSSDSDAGPSSSRSQSHRHSEDFDQFDAVPINTQSVIPHMVGGEIYLHQWKVMNTGSCPWTNDTTLNFTWGAKALKPLDLFIHVPHLKPDETGTLSVRLQIPHQPGQYECYWHFNHKGRRFGHWLGCQVIVDPFDLKGAQSVLERSFMTEFITTTPQKFKANDQEYDIEQAVTQYSEIVPGPSSNDQQFRYNLQDKEIDVPEASEETVENDDASNVLNRLVRDISARVEDIKLEDPTDTNCSSDSDNQSIISLSESNSSKSIPEEFVVVPIPDCFKIDPVNNVASENIKEQINKCNDAVVSGGVEETSQVQTDKTNIEQDPDNFDNNNNSEEIDKNASTSGSIIKADDDASSCEGSQKSDIVIVTLPDDKELDEAEYAYVLIDGHKVPIPKKIIKSEYLQSAEGTLSTKGSRTRTVSSASSIEIVNKEDETPQEETTSVIGEQIQSPTYTEVENKKGESYEQNVTDGNTELFSHCSAAGSSFSDVNSGQEFNSRLFIFPQSCPGYEVRAGEDPLTAPPLNLSTHGRNPFISSTSVHVPNYQQTPPELRPTHSATILAASFPTPTAPAAEINISTQEACAHATGTTTPEDVRQTENSPPVHILPETLMSGAVNAASSAINTARSVLNMIVTRETPVATNGDILQQPGRWINGHWVSTNPETPREANLQALAEMGFWNRDLNATLLARYNDDLSRVVAELVQ